MTKGNKTVWRYRAIPHDLDAQVKNIVDADHYPMGKWHSQDHFVVDAVKKAVDEYKAERKESTPAR